MANLISYASGNLTGAATWKAAEAGTGSASPTVTTNVTSSTTSYVNCPQFTIVNGDVIEGILIHCRRLSATGTFTVGLFDDSVSTTVAQQEVTVNASDLPASLSWVFFKFSATHTGDGGADYRIGIKSSTANTVSVARASATAADWCKLLRTSATATAVAADNLYVVGEWTAAATGSDVTVTMDSTAATDYGRMDIGQRGILTWGTSAATAYVLQISGILNVWAGGTYNQGTVATPMPRDSTATLQFDCTTDGEFGLVVNDLGTAVLQGQSRTSGKLVDRCLLSVNESAGSTSLDVDTDTGWLDNDRIAVASTTRTATECETGTLNGNAGASSLTVDGFAGVGGGLAFAHLGTAPAQAEVILLTRNVVVRSVSTTAMAYVTVTAAGNLDADWTEFRYLGENVTGKRGIELQTTTGAVTIDYCSICDCEDGGLYLTGTSLTGTLAVTDLVMWNCANVAGTSAISNAATSGSPTLTDIIVIRVASTTAAVNIADVGTTFNGLVVVGASGTGIQLVESNTIPLLTTINNLTAHACTSYGIVVQSGSLHITNIKVWRCLTYGFYFQGSWCRLENVELFGNSQANIYYPGGHGTFINVTSNGDTSFGTTYGVYSLAIIMDLIFLNCNFSTASGIKTATTYDIFLGTALAAGRIDLRSTKLVATLEVGNNSNLADRGIITSQKHDQTNGNHKFWLRGGLGQTDATIYKTAAPSERLTPLSASIKLPSGPRLAAVDSGGTRDVSVWVRKSQAGDGAAYNGAQPRLILRRNDALGVTSDTVLDTMTASAGTWEQLTGTTPSAGDDGAFEIVVDCDGTVGWINVDDWAVT